MYWRIRKYGPIDILKKYGVHIVLVFSLFLNFLLIVTRPNLHKIIPTDTKQQMDQFARKVTNHILDTSYISFQAATDALLNKDAGELSPPVINSMRQQQLLPNDNDELKAEIQTYNDQKRVVAIRIDQVDVGEPTEQSLVPVDVIGMVAVHSADESGPPRQFHFQFLIGYRPNTQIPIIAGFKDLSPS